MSNFLKIESMPSKISFPNSDTLETLSEIICKNKSSKSESFSILNLTIFDKFCNNIDTHNLNYIEYCEDNCVIDLIKYIKINGKTVQKQRFTRIYILYNIIKKTIENNDSRLLNYFININPKIAYFDEIIIEASKRQSYIVVKFCLNYPINNINFLLEYAAEYSHNINIVNLLINKGANSVLVLNHALTKACLYQYGDLCALLISKGANECYNGIYFTHNH